MGGPSRERQTQERNHEGPEGREMTKKRKIFFVYLRVLRDFVVPAAGRAGHDAPASAQPHAVGNELRHARRVLKRAVGGTAGTVDQVDKLVSGDGRKCPPRDRHQPSRSSPV